MTFSFKISGRPKLRWFIVIFVFVLFFASIGWGYRTHLIRQRFLRSDSETKFVFSQQIPPGWLTKLNLGNLVPSSMFQQAYAIRCHSDEELLEIHQHFDLSEVTYIHLSGQDITDSSFEIINQCHNLQTLSLFHTSITSKGLLEFKTIESLTSFTSHQSALNDDFFKHPHRFPNLTELAIGNTELTNEGLRQIRKLPSLSTLHLTSCPGITNEGIPYLGQIPLLTELTLTKLPVDETGLDQLRLRPQLRKLVLYELKAKELPPKLAHEIDCAAMLEELELWDMEIAAEDILKLSTLPALRLLGVSDCTVTTEFLEKVSQETKITELFLSADQLNREHIETLNRLQENNPFYLTLCFDGHSSHEFDSDLLLELREPPLALYLKNLTLSAAHINYLEKASYSDLTLINVNLDQTGLQFLGQTNSLRAVQLQSILINDNGLESLCNISLEMILNIDSGGLEDSSIEKLLQLDSLPPEINLMGNHFSREARQKLLNKAPESKIEF